MRWTFASEGNMAKRKNRKRSRKRNDTMSWLLLGVGVVVVVGIIAFAVLDAAEGGGDGVTSAEEFDLPNLDGDGRVRLADFAGRPTVVNFFASWCTACNQELPEFRDTATALDGQVDFVFVNTLETGNWKPMAEDNGIRGEFPIAKDIKGQREDGLYRSVGGTGSMPITAFYDSGGNLVHIQHTALIGGALPALLRELGFVA